MVEPIMFFTLGFLAASLIALVIVPLVHARAVRLTTRRVESSAPISIAEIQADKDQLRAEFAMATRRLEMNGDQLKIKTTAQLAELGRKTEAINQLKVALDAKTAEMAAAEAREKALQDKLRGFEEELDRKADALGESERKLTDLEERAGTADSHRIEIVTLKTQVATLRDQIGELERNVQTAAGRTGEIEIETELAETKRERERIRSERDAAQGREMDLRAEKAALEQQLERGREERVENTLLHERINDVSAEVVRLTAALEGPDSPIDTILAADQSGTPANGKGPLNGAEPAAASHDSLADRIRALQSRAARAVSSQR